MWRQSGQILLLFIAGLALALLNFSFSSALPGLAVYLNPGLIVLIFILFFLGFNSALYFILFFGIFSDVLSFQVFSIHTISLTIAALTLNFILQNLLTNKSLYSLTATVIGFTLIYNLSLALLYFIFSALSRPFALSANAFWFNLGIETAWGLVFALLLFHPLVFWFKKFKPFFLENKRSI